MPVCLSAPKPSSLRSRFAALSHAALVLSADPTNGQTLPAPETLPTAAAPVSPVSVNLDTVLRLTDRATPTF